MKKNMDDTGMPSVNPWHDRFFKIISVFGFLLVFFILIIILRVGPASAYEFSIYDAYPWYFWALVLSALVCGQAVIFGSALSPSKKKYWYYGLGEILVVSAILLYMPIIRGYAIYGWYDVLTHIGYMRDILRTAGVGENFYPVAHILGVIIHVFSGLSLSDITLVIPAFFFFFFIVSLYFVGKTIFEHTTELLMLVLLSSIVILGASLVFVPNVQAFLLVPLILYLAFKMYYGVNNKKYQFLLLLISFLIVFYHPLVTIMVILILCFMQIMLYFQQKYEKRSLKKVNYLYSIFFIFTIFTLWSTYIAMATYVMKPLIMRFFGEETIQSELQNKLNVISQVNIEPLYLAKLILNVYGTSIFLGLFSIFCIGLILISMKNQKTKSNFFKGVSVMGFIVFAVLSIGLLFTNSSFGFGRIFAFATLFSLILVPAGVYLLLYNNPKATSGKKIVKLLFVFSIFFCITYFSLFNLYQSPIVKLPNQQVPQSNYIGMNTFFSYRDKSLPIFELGPSSNRFFDALYGQSVPRENINYISKLPPRHFGYQNETELGIFYAHSKYMLVNALQKGLNPTINPEFENKWSFAPKDFDRLKSDTKVNQVYSNNDLEIFLVREPQQE